MVSVIIVNNTFSLTTARLRLVYERTRSVPFDVTWWIIPRPSASGAFIKGTFQPQAYQEYN